MDEPKDEALIELYCEAYGCTKGPDCWCATAERIAEGDAFMARRAEAEARTQSAGG